MKELKSFTTVFLINKNKWAAGMPPVTNGYGKKIYRNI
jgi:hypothetical protein